MTITMTQRWDDVSVALDEARGIAFDGCHKIYVLMDDFQVTDMADIGYEVIEVPEDVDRAEALEILLNWYESSCFLRFVSSIRTIDGETTNDSFEDLIPQGAEEDDE